jgi:hypothetical protein
MTLRAEQLVIGHFPTKMVNPTRQNLQAKTQSLILALLEYVVFNPSASLMRIGTENETILDYLRCYSAGN